jgi:hypothetical protein
MWIIAVLVIALVGLLLYAYKAYIDKSDRELLAESREGHWLWYGREVGMLGLVPHCRVFILTGDRLLLQEASPIRTSETEYRLFNAREVSISIGFMQSVMSVGTIRIRFSQQGTVSMTVCGGSKSLLRVKNLISEQVSKNIERYRSGIGVVLQDSDCSNQTTRETR